MTETLQPHSISSPIPAGIPHIRTSFWLRSKKPIPTFQSAGITPINPGTTDNKPLIHLSPAQRENAKNTRGMPFVPLFLSFQQKKNPPNRKSPDFIVGPPGKNPVLTWHVVSPRFILCAHIHSGRRAASKGNYRLAINRDSPSQHAALSTRFSSLSLARAREFMCARSHIEAGLARARAIFCPSRDRRACTDCSVAFLPFFFLLLRG